MKRLYIPKEFNDRAVRLIEHCNDVLQRYEAQGYDLSLRQLYYQLVAANIVENTENSYKNLGSLVSDARLAGLVDWDMIKDRGREMIENSHWDSPADVIDAAASSFRINKWMHQPNYVEVMVEKQALEGVLQPVCSALDVPFSSNKGYSSSSALYEAGRRLAEKADEGKELHIIYLGDHDPSGIDMSRDVHQRLALFSEQPITLHRIALNMDQVERLNPPENPAKLTDSRASSYISKFGSSSWELDAIEPRELAALVRRAVDDLRDPDEWDDATVAEKKMRDALKKYATDYRKKHEK